MKKYFSVLVVVLSVYCFSQLMVTKNSAFSNADLEKSVSTLALKEVKYQANDTLLKKQFRKEFTKSKDVESATAPRLVDVSKNLNVYSSNEVKLGYFPTTEPLLTIGMDASQWQDLNVSSTINVTNPSNINLINVDGFTQINNTKPASYQFAIGVFVDNELKLVKKITAENNNLCTSKEFNIDGVLENLSVGKHEVKVYAYNLPKLSDSYSSITYGGNASGCSKTNEQKSRINLSVQVSE